MPFVNGYQLRTEKEISMKKYFLKICLGVIFPLLVWNIMGSALGMTVYASEEIEQEESMTEIYLDDAKMSIHLPASYYVLEQEIEEDDVSVAAIGLDREKVQTYFADYQIMLYALAQDNNHEIVVTMNHSDDLQYIYRLGQLDKEHVEELLLATKESYEESAYEVSNAQIAEVGGTKYIIFDMKQTYGEQVVVSQQYYTINDGDCYHITLRSYTGEITADMEATFTQIIDSIQFEDSFQGSYYQDANAGVTFGVSPGWQALEMEESEEYIQMQFVHSNGLGESIQFLCQDIWGRLGKMQQLTTTRIDIDKRCMEPEDTQKWLPAYMGNLFEDYGAVYTKEYGGITYYTSDELTRIETESSQGDYLVRSVVTVRNGILYAFRYGYYENGNLHEDNFETTLSTITYTTADLLTGDHQDYQDMIDMVQQAFVGIILIIIVLTVIILFYVLGNYEVEQETDKE